MNKTINPVPAVWKKIDSFGGNTTSPVLTAWRPCPVCGAFECRTLLTFDDFQFYGDSAELPKRIQVRQAQCLTCQAIFMNPGYSETAQRVLFAAAGNSFRSRPEHQTAQVRWLEQRGLAAAGQSLLDGAACDAARDMVSGKQTANRLKVSFFMNFLLWLRRDNATAAVPA